MRIKSGLAVVVALALGASSVACKDKENPPPAPAPSAASATPQSSAPVASASGSASADSWDASAEGGGGRGRHERGPHTRGLSALFFRAAKDLTDLKDEQKPKIEEAQKKTHDESSDARDEMKKAGKELHAEIVAGIKAGKIDAAKLEPKYAALEKLQKAQHEKEDEGLNALHAALTPPQRKALVEDVKKKQAQLEERMKKREEKSREKAEERAKKHVERLTADLGLDADQQKKVDAIAPPPAQGPDRADLKKRTDALLAAFDKDTFDAKKLDAFDAKKARAPMEAQTKLVGQILAVLKPEQREKLAAKVDKGPSPHGRRGGGGGGDRSRAEEDDDDDD